MTSTPALCTRNDTDSRPMLALALLLRSQPSPCRRFFLNGEMMQRATRIQQPGSIMMPILLALAAACSGDSSRTPTAPSGSTFGVKGARAATVPTNECAAGGTGWIFCDDFQTDRFSSYYP